MAESGTEKTEGVGEARLPAPEPIDFEAEIRRVRAVYAKRQLDKVDRRYSKSVPYHVLAVRELRRALGELIRAERLHRLMGGNILEIGCGNGAILRHLPDFGAEPRRLFGIDLLPELLQDAGKRSPDFHFVCGNGGQLPFAGSSFGLVFAFTVFTSVLEVRIKRSIADEIMRVLQSGGKLVWYDFAYNNPWNANVRGIGRRELRDLFPRSRIVFRRLTLTPPLGRVVSRISPAFFYLFSALKIFASHQLCLIEK